MGTQQIMSDDAQRARAIMDGINEGSIRESVDLANNTEIVTEISLPSAQQKYQEIAGNNDEIDIKTLMDNAGVCKEDFQALCNEHPEMIAQIGGGKTCTDLAKVADRVNIIGNGGYCLPGVRKLYFQCQNDSMTNASALRAQTQYTTEHRYQGTNGGCSGYETLEGSGNYVSVALKNTAYGKAKGCEENTVMNNLFKTVQPGITVTMDSVEDNNMRRSMGHNGAKYGHIAVKRSDNRFACDIRQENIGFTRYGEYAHVCFPKDAYVSKEYAEMLIEKAQTRMANDREKSNTEINNGTSSQQHADVSALTGAMQRTLQNGISR